MKHPWENYSPLVRAMARRYQGPGLEREDLEQEAWLALVAAEAEYRPELMVPRPAYYKCRIRAALAAVLRKYRRDALFWRTVQPTELSAAREGQGEVWELLAGLPSRQQEVLRLYYLHDLPLKDIAARLKISVSAVHTHKQRGLAALRHLSRSKKAGENAPT